MAIWVIESLHTSLKRKQVGNARQCQMQQLKWVRTIIKLQKYSDLGVILNSNSYIV